MKLSEEIIHKREVTQYMKKIYYDSSSNHLNKSGSNTNMVKTENATFIPEEQEHFWTKV